MTAWGENLILERFYAPVLDRPSGAGLSGLRWPAQQRADMARQVTGDRPLFVSAAEPYAIYVWSTRRLWTFAALAIIAIIAPLIFLSKPAPERAACGTLR